MKKSLKFRDFLAPLILSGEKSVTWRLFDDKNLQKGDEVELVNWNTGDKFAEAIITFVRQKSLGDLEESDYKGHERFKSDEAMYKAYQKYYKDENVGPDTTVKIIGFQLK